MDQTTPDGEDKPAETADSTQSGTAQGEPSASASINGAGKPPGAADDTQPGTAPIPVSASALIIGQATAILTIAAALIYAAGGLSLGLKLWYDQFEWEPVLGQLPRSFILIYAVIVIVPAIIVGVVAYLLYTGIPLVKRKLSEYAWLSSRTLAATLAVVPVVLLPFLRKTTLHGVLRPDWQIFVTCFIFNLVFIRLALYLLPKTNVKGLQEVLRIAVFMLAFTPAVASVYATSRFPLVYLCGPTFASRIGNYSYVEGNLIGTNGQWVYVSQAVTEPTKPSGYRLIGTYIAVVPLSAVQLESIGPSASCYDLHAPVTPAG